MLKRILQFTVCASLACSAHATWQEEMNLLTAGAAASVVAMHSCEGQIYSDNANQYAATKLRQAAMAMPDSDEAFEYASHAFEIKVKALWQSTAGECENTTRLHDIARSTGFLAPKAMK